jgi:hypothetical protein
MTSRNTKFQGKDEYLQYRKQWKHEYAQLSADTRDFKFCRKSLNTIAKLGQTDRYNRVKSKHSNQFGFWPEGLAFKNRHKATAMLEELKAAKIEAQRQYLSARNALDATVLSPR